MEDSLIRCGKGEDLVMLHGYLSCKESFYHQIKYLSNFYKVTAFDFRGMGKSAPLAQPWSVEDYADHTRRLLDELGVRRPRLLAHSFGGRVAIRLLADGFPAHSALLTGCAGVPPKRGLRYRLREEDSHYVKEGTDYYRVSRVYRLSLNGAGEQVNRELLLDNHSKVMFDENLIAPELIRE